MSNLDLLICLGCGHAGDPPPPPALSCCPERQAVTVGDILSITELARLAGAMRNAQKHYFKTRNQVDLLDAKKKEREYDAARDRFNTRIKRTAA